MSKISCRNTHSQNMVSCLLLGLLWTWNWIVYQSPTDLLISIGEWRLPSRSLLLASFAVAGFFFFFTNRRSKKKRVKKNALFHRHCTRSHNTFDRRTRRIVRWRARRNPVRHPVRRHGRGQRLPLHRNRTSFRPDGIGEAQVDLGGSRRGSRLMHPPSNHSVLHPRKRQGRAHGSFPCRMLALN